MFSKHCLQKENRKVINKDSIQTLRKVELTYWEKILKTTTFLITRFLDCCEHRKYLVDVNNC